VGCRLNREVVIEGGSTSVQSNAPNECSDWIAENAPSHRHSWEPTGCWFHSEGVISCMIGPPALFIDEDRWLAFLKSRDSLGVKNALEAAAGGEDSVAELRERVDLWRANHPLQTDQASPGR
jgi:hypothetical protein